MSSLVYVKNPNGKTYVYSNTSIYDKETKKVKHIRKSIGHLDPVTGEVVPNRRKGDAARKRAQTEEPAGRCVVKNTGIQSLLDKAVSDIGLMGPLSTVFPVTFCKGLFNQIHRKFTFQGKKIRPGTCF